MVSSSSDKETLEKLASGLEYTSKLAQSLLHEIKESEKDFAVVKTELSIIHETVKSLSKIVREGNGEMSLLTKAALLSDKIQQLQKDFDIADTKHDSIDKRLILLERDFSELKEIDDNEKRAKMDSINKEIELAHETSISKTKVSEEREKTLIKVVSAAVIAVITFLVTYFTNYFGK